MACGQSRRWMSACRYQLRGSLGGSASMARMARLKEVRVVGARSGAVRLCLAKGPVATPARAPGIAASASAPVSVSRRVSKSDGNWSATPAIPPGNMGAGCRPRILVGEYRPSAAPVARRRTSPREVGRISTGLVVQATRPFRMQSHNPPSRRVRRAQNPCICERGAGALSAKLDPISIKPNWNAQVYCRFSAPGCLLLRPSGNQR